MARHFTNMVASGTAMAIIKEMEAQKAAEKARKKAEARAARKYYGTVYLLTVYAFSLYR